MYKLVGIESETEALRAHLEGGDVVISQLTRVEVRRAAIRYGLEANVAEALENVFALSIDDLIIERAGELRPDNLRSLDAIQLATALRAQHDIDSFVCYDKRLAAACEHHGLHVEQPA